MTNAKYIGQVKRMAGQLVGYSKRCSPGKAPLYTALYPGHRALPRRYRSRGFAPGAITSYGHNKGKYKRDPYVFDKGWWR